MRELDEVLAAGLDARERAERTGAPAGVLDRVSRRVRRTRMRRHAAQGVAAVAVVGAVCAAGWWGLSRPAPEPAVTPTPTATVTPTPSSSPTLAPTPTPSEEPTATETPSPSTEPWEVPGIPSALVAPENLLDHTGEGWVLGIYRADPVDDELDVDHTSHAVLALAPDGTRYHLADLPPDLSVRLVDWRVGESRARVQWGLAGTDSEDIGWLDLRTGTLEPDVFTWADAEAASRIVHLRYFARLADGTDLFEADAVDGPALLAAAKDGQARVVGEMAGEGSSPDYLVSPSGTRVASLAQWQGPVVVLDVATGERRVVSPAASDEECAMAGWLDDSALLVACGSGNTDVSLVERHPHLVRVDVDAGKATEVMALGLGDPFVLWPAGTAVTPGVVVFPGAAMDSPGDSYDKCSDSLWRWSAADGLRRLVAPGVLGDVSTFAVAGDQVFAGAVDGCGGDWKLEGLSRIEPDGSVVELSPTSNGLDTGYLTDLSWTPAR